MPCQHPSAARQGSRVPPSVGGRLRVTHTTSCASWGQRAAQPATQQPVASLPPGPKRRENAGCSAGAIEDHPSFDGQSVIAVLERQCPTGRRAGLRSIGRAGASRAAPRATAVLLSRASKRLRSRCQPFPSKSASESRSVGVAVPQALRAANHGEWPSARKSLQSPMSLSSRRAAAGRAILRYDQPARRVARPEALDAAAPD